MAARERDLIYENHFDGKRFYNPGAPQARGWLDVLRWKLNGKRERSPALVNDVQPSVPPPRVQGDSLRVTLVNHSTVLLQLGGINILTDPVWSERVSPFPWIGPRRRRAPGIRWERSAGDRHRLAKPQSLRSPGSAIAAEYCSARDS